MKRIKGFLCYVLLPGIVLVVVYQMGREAGSQLVGESQSAAASVVAETVPVEKAPRPAKPSGSSHGSVPAKSVSADVAAPPKATKVESVHRPAKTTKAEPVRVTAVAVPEHAPGEVPVVPYDDVPIRIPQFASAPMIDMSEHAAAQIQSRPVSVVLETDILADPMVYAVTPPTNEPYPAPTNSVYDRQPDAGLQSSAVPKSSEMGLMPLRPLTPIPATVYSAPLSQSAAPRTTFKEPAVAPALAPPVPIQQSAPAPQKSSFIRITSSSECDCGKEH